ncbi:hypothetical protein BC829DRAFT_419972 [Chytridium lagenaria]|nr:hypothetical protein BC829DRAFT_419972 [Chytridium lagenaria]
MLSATLPDKSLRDSGVTLSEEASVKTLVNELLAKVNKLAELMIVMGIRQEVMEKRLMVMMERRPETGVKLEKMLGHGDGLMGTREGRNVSLTQTITTKCHEILENRNGTMTHVDACSLPSAPTTPFDNVTNKSDSPSDNPYFTPPTSTPPRPPSPPCLRLSLHPRFVPHALPISATGRLYLSRTGVQRHPPQKRPVKESEVSQERPKPATLTDAAVHVVKYITPICVQEMVMTTVNVGKEVGEVGIREFLPFHLCFSLLFGG